MDSTYKDRTIAYYNADPEQYAQFVDGFYSTEQISSFLSYLPDNPYVLDAGSGTGRDANIMTQQGARVLGLDLATNLVNMAQAKYPHIEFVVGDMTYTNLPDATFDGIWCHAALFHLETEAEVVSAINEFYRILKPQGFLHLLVKQHQQGSKVKIFTDPDTGHSRLYRFFEKTELESLLQNTNFKVVIAESYDENERNPQGRPEVTWLHILAQKIS